MVYPTLTPLENIGYASASVDVANRKLYAITPEGQSFLGENKPQVDTIFARLAGESQTGGSGVAIVIRAMWNLRASVKLKLSGRAATCEQIQAVSDVLDEAAKKIERM